MYVYVYIYMVWYGIYVCMYVSYIYINRVQRWFEFIGLRPIEFFLDLLRCSCVVAGPGVGSPWSASNGQAPRILLPTTNWEYDWEMLGISPTISN